MNYPHIPVKLQKDPKLPSFFPFFLAVLVMLAVMLLLFFGNAKAEEINLDIIAKIESSNNPLAYNPKSKASGLYQITEICLKDFNQENNAKISPQSLFDPKIGELVAEWYLRTRIPQLLKHYKLKHTIENLLIAYNFGVGNLIKYKQNKIKLPKETQLYLLSYRKYRNKH